MRVAALILVAAAALMAACRSKKPLPMDTSEAGDIPREVAVSKLGELLPTTDYVYCTIPKDSLKATEIKGWKVESDKFQIIPVKGEPFVLAYADITAVQLARSGRSFLARVFSIAQKDANKDHFSFLWKTEESAKRAVELFEALRAKP